MTAPLLQKGGITAPVFTTVTEVSSGALMRSILHEGVACRTVCHQPSIWKTDVLPAASAASPPTPARLDAQRNWEMTATLTDCCSLSSVSRCSFRCFANASVFPICSHPSPPHHAVAPLSQPAAVASAPPVDWM